jgi:CRISPR-associated protein Cas2
MHILIAYDVATQTQAGQKRLRRIAQACLNYGQRVQKSVFECSVNEMQYEELTRQLLKILNEQEDSLRMYRLAQPKDQYLRVYGVDTSIDFDEPLIL